MRGSRRAAAMAVGLVAAVAVAAPGGAAAQSTTTHKLDRVEPITVQADDGARLRGHVYLPDRPGPLATVLNLSPYHDAAGAGSPPRTRRRTA
jgi:predicted acyl esterase